MYSCVDWRFIYVLSNLIAYGAAFEITQFTYWSAAVLTFLASVCGEHANRDNGSAMLYFAELFVTLWSVINSNSRPWTRWWNRSEPPYQGVRFLLDLCIVHFFSHSVMWTCMMTRCPSSLYCTKTSPSRLGSRWRVSEFDQLASLDLIYILFDWLWYNLLTG